MWRDAQSGSKRKRSGGTSTLSRARMGYHTQATAGIDDSLLFGGIRERGMPVSRNCLRLAEAAESDCSWAKT